MGIGLVRALGLALVLCLGAAVQAANDSGQASVALQREFGIRRWALALAGAEFPAADASEMAAALDEWRAASASSDWSVLRAGLLAVARAPRIQSQAEALAAVRAGLFVEQPSVVEAALIAAEGHGWFALLVAEPVVSERLLRLTEAPLPAVRSALAAVAGRLTPPVSSWIQSEQLILRIEILEKLVDDVDPAVRGTARRTLFLMETPLEQEPGVPVLGSDGLDAARTALLHRLVVDHRFDEIVTSLEVLSRAVSEPHADLALSAWAAADTPAVAMGLGLDEALVRGLIEAVIFARGGRGQAALVARAFADWGLVRTSVDWALSLNSWASIDKLLRRAAESPGDELADALLDESYLVGTNSGGEAGRAWTHAQFAFSHEINFENFSKHLFGAVVSGRTARQALALFSRRRQFDFRTVWFLEQFVSGLTAEDVRGLESALGLNEPAGPPLTWRTAFKGSVEPGILQAYLDNFVLAYGSRPDAATELLLLDILDILDVENPYWHLEQRRFATAFRAICSTRYSAKGRLEPVRLMPAGELFRRLSASITALWKQSAGVRLDLLSVLPHVQEMDSFASLLILVGERGGVDAAYRGTCVDLLGACRGNGVVHETLEAWLDAELEQRVEVGPLSRGLELKLAGFAEAIAANGASIGRGEQRIWELLELAIKNGRNGLPAKELGKAGIWGMLRFSNGVARLDARFLHGGVERERRLRVEAALAVLASTGVSPEIEERATQTLIEGFKFVGWDLAPRLAAALGKSDLDSALDALVTQSAKYIGVEAPVEAVSLLDALVVIAQRRPEVQPVVVEALKHTLVNGRALELRGSAIMRLVPLLHREQDAQLLGLFEDLVFSTEAALVAPAGVEHERAWVQSSPEIPFGLGTLVADELQFLQEKAAVALADHFDDSARLGQAIFGPIFEDGVHELALRWRGQDPKGGEFKGRTALRVFTARRADAKLLVPGRERADGRLLLSLANVAQSDRPELAAWLFDAALVALRGEPIIDLGAWTEAAVGRLGLAWEASEWAVAGMLADELSWRRRQGGLSRIALRDTLGNRDATRGIDSRARIESLRFQAAAHQVGDPEALIQRASQLVGISAAAARDQATLQY